MSRSAVSGEHLAIAAHLLLVSLPSKPSSKRLSSLICRSFKGNSAQRCQLVAPIRPIPGLPDTNTITAIHAEIMGLIHRKSDRLHTGSLGAGAAPYAARTGMRLLLEAEGGRR